MEHQVMEHPSLSVLSTRWNKCGYEKQCKTTYQKKCQKPKPAYGAPSYGAPKPQCTQYPVEQMWI